MRSKHIAVLLAAAIGAVWMQANAAETKASGEPLLYIEGQPIAEKDLDGRARGLLTKAKADMYDAKKKASDEFLFQELINREAKKAGKTPGEIQTAEIDNKIKKVADKDIKEFYENFKKSAPPGRQMAPLDQLSDRIRQKLEEDLKQERRADYFDQLKRRYDIQYAFTRPRFEVTGGTLPSKGSPRAPITIVEFSDFECPYCKRVNPTLTKVMKQYRGKVKLHFRDFPLSFHKQAKPAAVAARCANEQDQFWSYHDKLFENQKLEKEELVSYAKNLKLDVKKFESCLESPSHSAAVDKDIEEGANAGVTGTPAFFINGIPISGAQGFDAFKEIIDEELKGKGTSNKRSGGMVMP